ncbi:MAG TPA: helix-turn-helix transcriptional regulator [Solirubrobacterales bacterium]
MAPALLERHLLRARDLVDSRYEEPLDLEALASAAHVSPRHFSRSFRRVFGETPHQYLVSRRLERARHLLRTTEQSVAEICLSVGFTSVGSFTTTFTRHVGISPTTYRRASAAPSAADYIPLCALMAWARRPGDGAFREDSAKSGD